MVLVIQMFMLLTGGADYYPDQNQSRVYLKKRSLRSGMIAIVAVYGIAWMAETMFVRICQNSGRTG
ncbi:hypothetical protein MJ581_24140 [Escherichia coli]|nr:hypothetical protein MJ581_24140 [Escherichia coli]